MGSNLILGVLHQLDFAAVWPFLGSLQKTGSKARVHFFVSRVKARDLAQIQQCGATTEPFSYLTIHRSAPLPLLWPIWRRCFDKLPSFEARVWLARRVMHLFGIRWTLYHSYLSSRLEQFRRVLVTDVRDVYFQQDPFSVNFAPGLHCYLEAAGRTIGECSYNRRALGLPMGKKVLDALSNRPVSCAGTTIGDPASLIAYMEAMIDLLSKSRQFYEDQGVHNYVVHQRLIPRTHLHENGAHVVRTVGVESLESIPRDALGSVLGNGGGIVPILHQYDRHPDLKQCLCARL